MSIFSHILFWKVLKAWKYPEFHNKNLKNKIRTHKYNKDPLYIPEI